MVKRLDEVIDMTEREKDKEGKGEWVSISKRHSEGNDGVGTREQR